MKETVFGISEGTYIRITEGFNLITLNFIGRIQGTSIVLEKTEAQWLIREMSKILEGEE